MINSTKRSLKKCRIIAKNEAIDLRQSYIRVVKKLGNQQRFKGTKYGAKAERKANKKIQIIADRLVRKITRKLPLARLGNYLATIKLYLRVLFQKRGDSNKIYSLQKPNVKCYSKGKEHKKFEFDSKAPILIDQQTGIIMCKINFTETLNNFKDKQYQKYWNNTNGLMESSLKKYSLIGDTKK